MNLTKDERMQVRRIIQNMHKEIEILHEYEFTDIMIRLMLSEMGVKVYA